jgi:thiol:disulfide interchange protein
MFATFLWLGWVFSQQVLPARAAITLPGAQPYAAARLADLRAAGTPVFVDMTAAWCITCLVNERDALNTPAVQAAFARTGTQLLVGDWTSRDPAITAYLQKNQRDGVPLYVFYPAHGAPVVLPQILTPGVVVGVVR